MKKLGLYIHIPFCIKKCKYCGFVSFDTCGASEWKDYFKALKAELAMRAEEYCDYEVDTIFIGGGTPTIVPAEWIADILHEINLKFNNAVKQEITIESNPGTLTAEKLEIYKKSGINRLSIGVQSLDDTVLTAIGRIHDRKVFLDTYNEARRAGFDNINIDLMFSLPKQTDEIWEATLRDAIMLRPEHISFYSLQIEEGTEFYDMYKNGELDIADDDTDRARYHTAIRLLNEAGYHHYEISNAALDGYESQHNMKYWSLDEYLGIGLAAHSFAKGKRFYNTSDLNEYISAFGCSEADANISCQNQYAAENNENKEMHDKFKMNVVVEDEVCTPNDLIFEYVFTGLRKTDGISLKDFYDRFGVTFAEHYAEKLSYVEEQIALGFMILKQGRSSNCADMDKQESSVAMHSGENKADFNTGHLALTLKGIDVSNSIMAEFAE